MVTTPGDSAFTSFSNLTENGRGSLERRARADVDVAPDKRRDEAQNVRVI